MKKLPPPLPQKTFNSIITPWIDAINRRENISIFLMPKRDQLYRIEQCIKSIEYKKTKRTPVVIDLSSPLIEDENDLKIIMKKKNCTVFLLDADTLLSEKKHLLPYFEFLRIQKSISFLLFFRTYLLTEKYLKILSQYPFLSQNTALFPVFSKKDSLFFIHYLEQKLQVQVPNKVKDMIIQNCGGYLWLIKEAVREYHKTKKQDVFHHEGMTFRLQTMYEELSLEEKTVMKKLFLHIPLSTKDYVVQTYLLKSGTVIQSGKSYSHASSLFYSYFLDKISSESAITVSQKNQILLNNTDVSYVFSRLEKKLLLCLIKHKKTTVARNTVGSNIWNETEYSDWALDQLVRRVRNKLNKLGIEKTAIQTHKNIGYSYGKAI